jgi:hypothetical protein
MTFNLRLSRVVAMRQDSSYYNNWIPRKGGKIKELSNGIFFQNTRINVSAKTTLVCPSQAWHLSCN